MTDEYVNPFLEPTGDINSEAEAKSAFDNAVGNARSGDTVYQPQYSERDFERDLAGLGPERVDIPD